MKLSDYRGEDALDILAELIEPATEIISDVEIKKIAEEKDRPKLIKHIIKNHKSSLIEVLSILERKNPSEYAKEINVLTLPTKLLELLNDKELMELFSSAEQTVGTNASGSATESIKVVEKK